MELSEEIQVDVQLNPVLETRSDASNHFLVSKISGESIDILLWEFLNFGVLILPFCGIRCWCTIKILSLLDRLQYHLRICFPPDHLLDHLEES
ncbi:hypothetical protein HAX54_043121 [Datura stramonium]|uniref:Uncharacterized protein n=1 Tax=Datura stramonium TaxID=4076 RepID=A0ABS8SNC3_DATST|nr:hypothetical protein [Datura stramonium]